MAIKIIIGHEGKSKVVELTDTKKVQGLSIGDTFKGELVDLSGYEFEITGGADDSGFPMRRDVDGSQKRKILAVKGVGIKKKAKGIKQKKTVAGRTVGPKIAMLNVKVAKKGKSALFEEPKAEAEEAPAESAE